MSIDVIFATRNGARSLERVLTTMRALASPPVTVRFIVVDNGSTDTTRQTLSEFKQLLPLTVLFEPAPGKNRALNRALEASRADLVILCDDDVLPKTDWLQAWWSAASEREGYDLFGGPTRPEWPMTPEPWILDWVHLGVVFALNEEPEGPCPAAKIHGTNMAVRGHLLRSGLRFSEAVGPDGSPSYAMGSETEFLERAEAAGARAWFAAQPSVRHIIREEQLSREWILRRGYRYGRGSALRREAAPPIPMSTMRIKNAARRLLYPIMLPFVPDPRRWKLEWQRQFDAGFAEGWSERMRSTKPS